jgi:RNA polymerase sigma-70 factor (ECF subfamily)
MDGEQLLIEAVQRGDPDAWREVIRRYQGRLLSFARRRLADPAEAEDVVQDTLLGLLRSLPNYDPTRSLETYLFAIIRHKLTDRFRRLRDGTRQPLDELQLEDTPAAWIDADTPSRHVAGQEALDAQRAALAATLRQWVAQCCEQRRFQDLIVIEMLVVAGLRNKEVASDLGLSETAVAGVKFRILEQWRRLTRAAPGAPHWQDADLAATSTLGRIWQEEGISCLKRSTLGRFRLGALDDDWRDYVEFHVTHLGCPRCTANLDDLADEQRASAAEPAATERLFASSVGFLSKRPPDPA